MPATGDDDATADDDATVGVVGDDALAPAVEAAGGTPVAGTVESVLDAGPALVVAAGDDALAALVRADAGRPVLAVDAGAGVPSVSGEEVEAAVGRALDGGLRRVDRLVLAVTVDGGPATRALGDVMLVSDEPARIAEYSVRSPGGVVARFRADGVVLATPAGSPGYANDAGGPVVEPGTGVATVVPVAPFVTDADHWVLDVDALALRVERAVPVALVVDGREVATLSPGEPVELRPARPLELLAAGGDWKHSNGERTQ